MIARRRSAASSSTVSHCNVPSSSSTKSETTHARQGASPPWRDGDGAPDPTGETGAPRVLAVGQLSKMSHQPQTSRASRDAVNAQPVAANLRRSAACLRVVSGSCSDDVDIGPPGSCSWARSSASKLPTGPVVYLDRDRGIAPVTVENVCRVPDTPTATRGYQSYGHVNNSSASPGTPPAAFRDLRTMTDTRQNSFETRAGCVNLQPTSLHQPRFLRWPAEQSGDRAQPRSGRFPASGREHHKRAKTPRRHSGRAGGQSSRRRTSRPRTSAVSSFSHPSMNRANTRSPGIRVAHTRAE